MKSWTYHNDKTMLWPVIFTALAISYVICVLMLSGLQKEDLDANTIEKLGRYNVNIYDLNNGSLRQDCLSKSDATRRDTNDVVEQQKYTSVTLANDQVYNKEKDTNNLTKITSTHFTDKANLQELMNMDHLKDGIQNSNDYFKEVNNNYNVATRVEQNTGQVTGVQKQPSLEILLKVWDRISSGATNATLSNANRTNHPIRREQEFRSTTPRTQTSNEYVNRIIAEYLATQTTSTTIRSTTKQPNIDDISKKIKDFLALHSGEIKNLEDLHSIAIVKNFESNLNHKENSDIATLGSVIPISVYNELTTQIAPRIYSPEQINTYYHHEQLERQKDVPYITPRPNSINREQEEKQAALQYLDNFLGFNKQFNVEVHMPYPEKSTENSLNHEDIRQQSSSNQMVPYIYEAQNNIIKDLSKTQNNGVLSDLVPTVSADFINVIAEKVKEIVMTNLKYEMPTAFVPMSARVAMITTTSPAPAINISVKENLTTLQVAEDKNEVRKTLMEILKEYKTLKESIIATTNVPLRFSHIYEKISVHNPTPPQMFPSAAISVNANDFKANIAKIEQRDVNPYSNSLLAVPWGLAQKPLQLNQHMIQTDTYPKNEYKLPPITIQTNSNQIPPLAIQLSNPMKVTNQGIISPPKLEQQSLTMKQQTNQKFTDFLETPRANNHNIAYPVNDDLTRKLSKTDTEKKNFRDSYHDRIQKLYDRIQYAHEINNQKAQVIDRVPGSEHHTKHLEGLNQYRLGQSSGSNHEIISKVLDSFDNKNPIRPVSTRLESYSWPSNLEQHQYLNGDLNAKHYDNQMHANYYDTFSQSRNRQSPEVFNPAVDKDYETLNRALNLNYYEALNEPLYSKYHKLLSGQLDSNRHEDPRPRDVTPEVLSRLADSRNRDLVNRLIKSSTHESRNRPTDHQQNNHHWNEYMRYKERPKPAKFHEKLERIENPSPNNYDVYNNKMAKANLSDKIASRQQMPLSNKKQKRTRFDDTHFRNFLKTQQKVTDMLEKILAAKTKNDFQSVETS